MKSKFKLNDYGANYAINLDEKWKYDIFCQFMHDNGKVWYDGSSYIEESHWNNCEELTCIVPITGTYGDSVWFRYRGMNILRFDDFDWSDYSVMVKYTVKVVNKSEMPIDFLLT